MTKYAASAGRRWAWVLALAGAVTGGSVAYAAVDDLGIVEAREAVRVKSRERLRVARDALLAAQHPLAPWADFWALQNRIIEASPSEVDAFLARWPQAYVADRMRNDWLLVLGQRRDWATFLRIQPSFRMNDDREVVCYGVLARQQTGAVPEGPGDLREQARQAWWAQKEPDSGCVVMAQTLFSAGVLSPTDVWRKLRLALESDKPKVAQQAAQLLGDPVAQAVARLMGQPRDYLMPKPRNGAALTALSGARAPGPRIEAEPQAKAKRKRSSRFARKLVRPSDLPQVAPSVAGLPRDVQGPLNLLALIRWASMDPQGVAAALDDEEARSRWQLSAEEAAWAWAQVARHSAWRLLPEAPLYFERALAVGGGLNPGNVAATWSADALAWMARAAVRAAVGGQAQHWSLVERAVDAMGPEQQQDPAWVYWKARALMARPANPAVPVPGAAQAADARQQGRDLLASISGSIGFYGLLAAEDLRGTPIKLGPHPARPTEAEAAEARNMPGIDRALRLFDLGWRTEAVREWNYTLSYGKPGGLNDRELLAVAEVACEHEIWDRCINTSERTRQEIDLNQRFPTPFKRDVMAAAQEVGLDAAYMYGLIRQESRFIVAARSHVGAAGLMQVMPATAEWTARRRGIDYAPELITDRLTNLKIGAGYLKLILDDFGGSQAMAAAAYNAGPGRPRRWREGPRLETAAWAENIPFAETRDYVKKVLTNAAVYGHVLHGRPLSIKTRLGAPIGPRAASAPEPQDDLP
ncbi:MAG: lytic transglycosylase domain-containing protein [Burkholderiales bacterium]|nr:lytic transglycosylase domain-containing protein [Burkholderiales bacterium]